jgi:hypothetical protein
MKKKIKKNENCIIVVLLFFIKNILIRIFLFGKGSMIKLLVKEIIRLFV